MGTKGDPMGGGGGQGLTEMLSAGCGIGANVGSSLLEMVGRGGAGATDAGGCGGG